MRVPTRRLRRSAVKVVAAQFTPDFFLPLQDAGAGAVNIVLARGLGSGTFTRATTAWTKLSTGLWASVASGTARSCYLGADTTIGAYGGYLAEEARTNLCLQARDLSNASWTKTNATGAKDQVGIDGAANSASSLTATLGGGSCVQTITQAATNAALSFFIKRITGTGTITLQQGATTSEISASVNSATYTRVSLVASVLNPSIGIVLGTNGDKIAVDMGQFENGAFATSPIPTTTVSVARNGDVLTYPSAGNAGASAGTLYSESVINADAIGWNVVIDAGVVNGDQAAMLALSPLAANGLQATIFSSTVLQASIITGAATIGTSAKRAMAWALNDVRGYFNGTAGTQDVVATPPASFTTIRIGTQATASSNPWNGTIKNVRIWTRALTSIQIAGF